MGRDCNCANLAPARRARLRASARSGANGDGMSVNGTTSERRRQRQRQRKRQRRIAERHNRGTAQPPKGNSSLDGDGFAQNCDCPQKSAFSRPARLASVRATLMLRTPEGNCNSRRCSQKDRCPGWIDGPPPPDSPLAVLRNSLFRGQSLSGVELLPLPSHRCRSVAAVPRLCRSAAVQFCDLLFAVRVPPTPANSASRA